MNIKSHIKTSESYKQNHSREKIEILYKDSHIVVIYKPEGILSVPYPGSKNKTAQSVLEDMLRKAGTANTHHKPYAVHRLDRDTSGVMMFALSESAQKKIMNTWHKMVIERLYRAVAEISHNAENLPDAGSIDDPIAQNAHNVGFVPKERYCGNKNENLRCSWNDNGNGSGNRNGNGKTSSEFETVPARTNYKIILRGQTHVLFELSLNTGKKNQIRAHLAAHGYPIAGDKEHRAHTDHFGRLCLHARTLEFNHPFTGELLKFEVEEPEEWSEYVKRGDKNSKNPFWDLGRSDFDSKHCESQRLQAGQKRLSGKDKAHMNFIESGKKFRK